MSVTYQRLLIAFIAVLTGCAVTATAVWLWPEPEQYIGIKEGILE